MVEKSKVVKKAETKTTKKPNVVSSEKETVEKKRIERYHISQDKEDKKRKVKLAGSEKVIKKFNTQREAINYTQNLVDNNDRGFVVHSRKGKIRKI